MKRSPMPPRKTRLVRRTELAKISAKGRLRARARRQAKAEIVERDGAVCWLAGVIEAKCFGPLEHHHLVKAWRRDPDGDTARNGVLLCEFHNGWVEDHPDEARLLGLVLREVPTVAPTSPARLPLLVLAVWTAAGLVDRVSARAGGLTGTGWAWRKAGIGLSRGARVGPASPGRVRRATARPVASSPPLEGSSTDVR